MHKSFSHFNLNSDIMILSKRRVLFIYSNFGCVCEGVCVCVCVCVCIESVTKHDHRQTLIGATGRFRLGIIDTGHAIYLEDGLEGRYKVSKQKLCICIV